LSASNEKARRANAGPTFQNTYKKKPNTKRGRIEPARLHYSYFARRCHMFRVRARINSAAERTARRAILEIAMRRPRRRRGAP
jgi:hypothetical protein